MDEGKEMSSLFFFFFLFSFFGMVNLWSRQTGACSLLIAASSPFAVKFINQLFILMCILLLYVLDVRQLFI